VDTLDKGIIHSQAGWTEQMVWDFFTLLRTHNLKLMSCLFLEVFIQIVVSHR
jgi:hypothetical protein